MEEPETTSEIIELSMQDPTEMNDDDSDASGDDGGTTRHVPAIDDWRQRFLPDLTRAARPRILRDIGVEDDESEEEQESGRAGDYSSSDGEESDGEGKSDRRRKKRKTREISNNDPWAGVPAPPADLAPPAAGVPPGIMTIPAGRTDTGFNVPTVFMKDFFCPGTGVSFPLSRSVKVCFWAVGPTGQRPFSTSVVRSGKGGQCARFKSMGTHVGVYNAPELTALKFQHLGSSPPPPGSPGTDTTQVYHFSVEKTDVPIDQNAAKPSRRGAYGHHVRAPPADTWEGMTAPPPDLTPPAAQVPPGRVCITAHRTSATIFLPVPFLRDFVAAATGLPFPLPSSLRACLWAEGLDGCRGFSAVMSRSLSVRSSNTAGDVNGFKSLGGHLGVYDAPEPAELEFRLLGSAVLPGCPENERIYHFSVRKCSMGSAAAPRAQTRVRTGEDDGMDAETGYDTFGGDGTAIAPAGDLVPPAAAVPPTRIDFPARCTVQTIRLSQDFLTDFFCPGTGLTFPLKDSVELCLWAEGPSGCAAIRRKLTMSGRHASITFRTLGMHLGVYNIDDTSTVEFKLLGSSPSSPGRPEVYHLSVKKVESTDSGGSLDAFGSYPAQKREAVPVPAPTSGVTIAALGKKKKAPSAPPPTAAPPLKTSKSTASVPPRVPAPAPAAANMQMQAAKPESSVPVLPAPHPLLLKTCTEGLKEIEQLAAAFSAAAAGVPSADPARHDRLDRASLDVAAGRAQELWAGSGIYVAQGIRGLLDVPTPEWCETRVPSLSEQLIQSLQRLGAGITGSLAAVLQGRPPHRLWVGPVGDGTSASQVISLGAIPAGSWVLQMSGEYVFGEAAVAAAGHPTARYIAANGGGVSGCGCVAPLAAALTPAQRELCSRGIIGRLEGNSDPRWRRLGETALDFSGTVAALLKGPAADANLETVEIDLPTGPTGVFLVACRDILPGERLVVALC